MLWVLSFIYKNKMEAKTQVEGETLKAALRCSPTLLGNAAALLLTAQAIDLWSWCLQRKITVAAQYIPRPENITADYLSRHLRDRTDWVLEPTIFNCVNTELGPLQVDLFAKRFSKQLLHFFNWRPDPEAEATDAFAQSWTSIKGFAHPPWCLIS